MKTRENDEMVKRYAMNQMTGQHKTSGQLD